MEESGSRWVEFVVDNRVVVDIINNTHSKEPHLMHLIKLLVFLACHYDFGFKVAHITVKENILADGLSKIMSLTLCRKSLKPPSNLLRFPYSSLYCLSICLGHPLPEWNCSSVLCGWFSQVVPQYLYHRKP